MKTIDRILGRSYTSASPRRIGRSLAAQREPHEPGATTNALYGESISATNRIPHEVARTRGLRRRLAERLLVDARDAAEHEQKTLAHASDPEAISDLAQAEVVRTRRSSGAHALQPPTVARLSRRIIATLVVLSELGFVTELFLQLWEVSFASFTPAMLPTLIGAFAIPLAMSLGIVSLTDITGQKIALARSLIGNRDRTDAILGADRWSPKQARRNFYGYLGAVLLACVFFYVLGMTRVAGLASDAGVTVPEPLIAVFFGALPLIAVFISAWSQDPLLAHETAVLRRAAAYRATTAELARTRFGIESRLTKDWLRLNGELSRIVAAGNESIQLFEQLLSRAYAESGAVGLLAPLREDSSPVVRLARPEERAAEVPRVSLPRIAPVEQLRGLSPRIAPWVVDELLETVQVLEAYRPTRWGFTADQPAEPAQQSVADAPLAEDDESVA